MNLRAEAKKRIVGWKKRRIFGWEMQKITQVDESALSKIYTGRGRVSDDACQKVLDAKEPK